MSFAAHHERTEGVPAYDKMALAPKETRYCLLIPVINEGERIRHELERARQAGVPGQVDVVICDGGSTDNSLDEGFLREMGVNTLLVKTDAGKQGAQLRMGISWALDRGYRGVVTIDGNDKDGIEAVPLFCAKLDEGYGFVQGSRFIEGGVSEHLPLSRKLAVKFIHAPIISHTAGQRFTDTTNAFRAYSKAYLEDPRVKPLRDIFQGYELLAYLSTRATQIGYKACEIPVSRTYPAAGKTPTKISPLKGNIGLLKVLLANARGAFLPDSEKPAAHGPHGLLLFLCFLLLTAQMLGNPLNPKDEKFTSYQADSEALVKGAMKATLEGEGFRYGLGRWSDVLSDGYASAQPITSDYFEDGYSIAEAKLALPYALASTVASPYLSAYCVAGNSVRFANGETRQILSTEVDGSSLIVNLSGSADLSAERCGSIAEIRFLDENGTMLPDHTKSEYHSQIGLQGMVFSAIASVSPFSLQTTVKILKVLLCLALAFVLLCICAHVGRRYGLLMAGVWYVVFLLSPWFVAIARNLYWVPITWFLPMLIGMILAEHPNHFVRYSLLAAIAMMIKCACGYEFITAVMLGAGVFPVLALIDAWKDPVERRLRIKGIFCLSLACVVGFAMVLLIHALMRGDGNAIVGMQDIWNSDVLRRTLGGDPANFSNSFEKTADSLNASIPQVVAKYFVWEGRVYDQVLIGFSGTLFPLLCIFPIFLALVKRAFGECSRHDTRMLLLYAATLLIAISWYMLGKSHSYIHTHINFVLWYFGFVQVCIYSLADALRWAVRHWRC